VELRGAYLSPNPLLQEVVADPTNFDARRVYADRLIEQLR
ncbi:MAG: hypothetical protein ACI9G1_003196, partial [Pirellulaceae bacterium]